MGTASDNVREVGARRGEGRNAGIPRRARPAPGVRSAPVQPGLAGPRVPGGSPHPPAPGPCSPHLRAASLAAPERPSAPRIPGSHRRPLSGAAAWISRSSGLLTAHATLGQPLTWALLAPPHGTAPGAGGRKIIGSDQSRSARPLAQGRRRRRGGTAGLCDSRNAVPGVRDSGD